MDPDAFNKFDNDADSTTDADYFAFVAMLSERTAEDLREALGNPEKQKMALCRYYKLGERANLTAGELIDFLAVSSPSIIDLAGYSDDDGDALMEISDNLTDDDLESAEL